MCTEPAGARGDSAADGELSVAMSGEGAVHLAGMVECQSLRPERWMPADNHPANALWRYVPALRRENDEWRLRLVLHDFGLVWEATPAAERIDLVRREPDHIDLRWDAFLAAYVEHLCICDGIEPPSWVLAPSRHLGAFWYAGGCHDYDRVRTIVTTPITFEAHGIWFPREELMVV